MEKIKKETGKIFYNKAVFKTCLLWDCFSFKWVCLLVEKLISNIKKRGKFEPEKPSKTAALSN